MKKYNIVIKGLLSSLLMWCLFSVSYAATTQEWWDILNQLRKQWRTDEEIRLAGEDLWYNMDEYLWTKTNTSKTNGITQQWQDVLNELKSQWRTEKEIKQVLEDLWYDPNIYFPSWWTNSTTYTSRSCKTYDIKYNDILGAYTSDNLLRKEYFVNTEYFKRYIDSKNPQRSGCPTNIWWIPNNYIDNSTNSDKYIAPNGKIYFITQEGIYFTSNELSTQKRFSSISDLKIYIKERNPLIWM